MIKVGKPYSKRNQCLACMNMNQQQLGEINFNGCYCVVLCKQCMHELATKMQVYELDGSHKVKT